MGKNYKTLAFLSLIALFAPSISLAAEFNPNYLISDQEMQQSRAMNREDITAFLLGKGGYISTNKFTDKDGIERDAADIIFQAAQTYQINPKYLLVKLQKEQSLVSDTDPSQKQLDWATGYSVCDSCSMDDPSIQRNKGFGKQVDSAAGIIRWYYDNAAAQTWIKKPQTEYTIDNTSVVPVNLATAFLYTYTPHLQGNKNFWTIWQKWFDQVYPDGTLLRSADSPTVYILQNGKRRAFKTMAALVTRYNPKLLITVPASELARYEPGTEISLPNYSILKNGSDYYLLDSDQLRPFASADTVRALGYNPDEIVDITLADVQSYEPGPVITADNSHALGNLVKVRENNSLYFIKDNTFASVLDPQIAKINFPNEKAELINASALANLTQNASTTLLKDGTLFKADGESSIYVVENGKKRRIASEEVFNGLGYNWKNIITINPFAAMAHPSGEPLYVKITTAPTTVSTPTPAPPVATSGKISVVEAIPTPGAKSKLYKTPENKAVRIGPAYDTALDTYLVADYTTGEILAGKNIDTVRPLASFTKVMTAYEIMKDNIKLSNATTYNATKHKAVYDSFQIGNGDQILNSDLMDSLLVSSLNTPANMLALNVAPDMKTFLARENKQAKAWGLTHTVFTDASGYDLGNKSTAREYLTIFRAAVKNADLQTYMNTPSYEYTLVKNVSGKLNIHRDTHSNGLMKTTHPTYTILASKTGYLDEAGAGLAMLIERKSDGKKFVIITMGNPDYPNRFVEPDKLTVWATKKF